MHLQSVYGWVCSPTLKSICVYLPVRPLDRLSGVVLHVNQGRGGMALLDWVCSLAGVGWMKTVRAGRFIALIRFL